MNRAAFLALVDDLRPALHRYCARMMGSAVEGEDVVQDTLLKALEAFPKTADIIDPEAWLFRVAHNTALDALRRRIRLVPLPIEQDDVPDPYDATERHEIAALGLRPFMKLSPSERSSVILKDVIGYSLSEIAEVLGITLPAVKAALHRGRARLSDLSEVAEPDALALSSEERALLQRYAERFNAHDFEAVRDMLAEDVRLDLVGLTKLRGRATVTARYLGNYDRATDWRFTAGSIDGVAALVAHHPVDPEMAASFVVLLTWRDGLVSVIRDFYHARYVIDGARVTPAGMRGRLA